MLTTVVTVFLHWFSKERPVCVTVLQPQYIAHKRMMSTSHSS